MEFRGGGTPPNPPRYATDYRRGKQSLIHGYKVQGDFDRFLSTGVGVGRLTPACEVFCTMLILPNLFRIWAYKKKIEWFPRFRWEEVIRCDHFSPIRIKTLHVIL